MIRPADKHAFATSVLKILIPAITKSLPDDWQNIDTIDKAAEWIKEREREATFLTVQLLSSVEVVGFIFLYEYESVSSNGLIDLRLGYLLSESVWGAGLGSELIKGLVSWCEKNSFIHSISGGVGKMNVGSIKVLEKNGFGIAQSIDQPEEMVFLERIFDHQK